MSLAPNAAPGGLLLEPVTRELFHDVVLLGRECGQGPKTAVDRRGQERKNDQQSQTFRQVFNPDSASSRIEMLCGLWPHALHTLA
jgi:hypothetical protein